LKLTTPTGERVGFTFTPVRQQITGAVYYTPKWIADASINYTLQSVDAKLTFAGSKFYELTSGAADNPASSSFDGTQYLLDSKQGLVGQIAPNGTNLIYSDSGIIDTPAPTLNTMVILSGGGVKITGCLGTVKSNLLKSFRQRDCR
jgi:hypothetical protein